VKIKIDKIPPNDNQFVTSAWKIKEEIHEDQGLLRQGRRFFNDTYHNGTVYLAINNQDEIIGFAITDRNYLALLGVKPSVQGEGIGKYIMKKVMKDIDKIRCHTRSSNQKAIKFYKNLGFRSKCIHKNYYENNEDANLMVFNPEEND
jgi:ribosomal-protein-alanine N-acetyltransferase